MEATDKIIQDKKFEEEQYINLGKHIYEDKLREETFQNNLEYLKNHFNNFDFKMKKEQVYTENIPQILDGIQQDSEIYSNIEENLQWMTGHDLIKLVLYIKFQRYLVKQKDKKIKQEIKDKEYVEEICDDYVEEIKKKETKLEKVSNELNNFKKISYIIAGLGIFICANFFMLYLVENQFFNEFWFFIINNLVHFVNYNMIYILYIIALYAISYIYIMI